MPPPEPAELLAMVVLVTVAVPAVVDAAAARAGRVVGDGGVGDRQRATVVDAAAVAVPAELSAMVELVTVSVPRVVDAAAAAAGGVVGDGGVGDRQRASVVDAAAVAATWAELPSMVELVTVSVPPLSMPPPAAECRPSCWRWWSW